MKIYRSSLEVLEEAVLEEAFFTSRKLLNYIWRNFPSKMKEGRS
jgi:hypothetical protein